MKITYCFCNPCSRALIEGPKAAWKAFQMRHLPRTQGDLQGACGRDLSAWSKARESCVRSVTLLGLIKRLCKQGRLSLALEALELLNQQGILISRDIFHSLLQQCIKKKDLTDARHLHSLMAKTGLLSVPVLVDHLIRLFASCGSLPDAHHAFIHIAKPTVFTWHAILSAYIRLGDSIRTLELYHKMQLDGVMPDKYVLSCMLTACGSAGTIHQGRILHNQTMVMRDLDIDTALENNLIDMYAKCGSLEDARNVFDNSPNRDSVSWGVMILGYARHDHAMSSLELLRECQEMGVMPDKYMFSGVLKACGSVGAIEQGRFAHEQITRSGLKAEVVVWSALADMYVKCGSLQDARKVFDDLQIRDTVSWGVMIGGYTEHGFALMALELFDKMQHEGFEPDQVICMQIIKACGSLGSIVQGRLIHDRIIKNGLEVDATVGSALVDMYCKSASLEEAGKVFENISNRDALLWVAMIGGYTAHGHGFSALELFDSMQQEGISPCRVALMCILKACTIITAVKEGRWIHDQIVRGGHESDAAIRCTLMDLYVKCGSLEEARNVFDGLLNQDPVLWGVMIAGYAQHGEDFSALELFEKMQQRAIRPDDATILHALKACGSMGAVRLGQLIHDHILRFGREADTRVGNTLVDMYANCGGLEEALKVFSSLSSRDVVSWGTIIVAYSERGNYSLAIKAFEDMQQQGIKPSDVIFTSLLAACSHLGLFEKGSWYFKYMTQTYGIVPSAEQYNCMVDLLSRAGHFYEAEDLLLTLQAPPNPIAWTSLLTSCKTYGKLELARRCFEKLA